MKKYFIATLIITSLFVSLIPISNVKANSSDPVFTWAKQLVGDEQGYNWPGFPSSLAEDSLGNIYITGSFSGTVDFDPGVGDFPLTSAGGQDTYILKLDSDGNFIWVKSIGEEGGSRGKSISLDSDSNIYVTGDFESTVDFDPGVGDFPLTSAGGQDTYILKLDSDGNFIWAKSVGGGIYDGGNSLSVDPDSNVYVTGYFNGIADFDPGDGDFLLNSTGHSADIYILKLDSDGNFIWAKSVGEEGDDNGYSLSFDSNSNVYVTGFFSDTVDFDPGAGNFPLSSAGEGDVYILKLDSDGNFIWAKSVGGETSDYGYSLSLDSDSNVYVVGYFYDTVDFDPGLEVFPLTSAGSSDAYILKLDSDGNFIWVKSIGGESGDEGVLLSLDSDLNLYTSGYFYGISDFNPGEEEFLLTSGDGGDSYILKLDSDGNFIWAGSISGGDEGNYPYSILVSGDNIYVAGEIYGISDMDSSDEVYNLDASISGEDSFILKLSIRDEENPQPPRTRTRSSGYASHAMLATFQQEQLQRAINAGLDTTPYQTNQTVNTTTPITRTLKYGMQGDDVKALQVYLNAHNYPVSLTGTGSLGNETNYFGLKTKQAAIKFQLANGLVGDGVVGPMTRVKLK